MESTKPHKESTKKNKATNMSSQFPHFTSNGPKTLLFLLLFFWFVARVLFLLGFPQFTSKSPTLLRFFFFFFLCVCVCVFAVSTFHLQASQHTVSFSTFHFQDSENVVFFAFVQAQYRTPKKALAIDARFVYTQYAPTCVCILHVYMYMYVYTHIYITKVVSEREREREREWEMDWTQIWFPTAHKARADGSKSSAWMV